MIRAKFVLAVTVLAAASGCIGRFSESQYTNSSAGSAANPMTQDAHVPPLDPNRKVSEQDCSKPVEIAAGNLMCKGQPTAAERRAMEEEERQRRLAAERRAKMEEEERAARERLERERAEQAALEAAALKARAAEEERLAAERKAREERELQARQEAEARDRQRAEQEAREAAERERQRLEQEWLAGRALLERFVANYGKAEKFKEVAEPITGFLDKTR
jgi:hypothetical protein